jgi:diadenosine tetraphosphate (Ap4A) HIT family hydrolase
MELINDTITRFGYPASLLAEYHHWVVLLRPQQVTIGSMVLACRSEATRMSDVGEAAFAEFARVTADIELALRLTFAHDKINYLALMMVDRHVHFHVLPRYASERQVLGRVFVDGAWPVAPDLTKVANLEPEQQGEVLALLRQSWPPAR